MSCEGYYQCICKNRHYETIDFLDERLYAEGKKIKELCCEECGAPYIWTNFVDDTNWDEFGKIEVVLDENDFVPIHLISKLQQIKYEKDTGFYNTCGDWSYTRRHGESDYIISANGTPVIAVVLLDHVSINTQKANAKSICAVPKMLKVFEELSMSYFLISRQVLSADEILERFKVVVEKAESILDDLKEV